MLMTYASYGYADLIRFRKCVPAARFFIFANRQITWFLLGVSMLVEPTTRT